MRRVGIVATAVALAAAACGGPEAEVAPVEAGRGAASPNAEATGGAERVDPRDGGFEVGFGEYAITLEAEAIRSGPVTFVIHNGGAEVHGFEMEIEGEDDSSGSGSGDDGFKIERPTFGPGETIRVLMDLAPGIYKVECFVANHDDLGMEALLEISPNAPLVRGSFGRRGGHHWVRVRAGHAAGHRRDGGDLDERRPHPAHGDRRGRLVRLRLDGSGSHVLGHRERPRDLRVRDPPDDAGDDRDLRPTRGRRRGRAGPALPRGRADGSRTHGSPTLHGGPSRTPRTRSRRGPGRTGLGSPRDPRRL